MICAMYRHREIAKKAAMSTPPKLADFILDLCAKAAPEATLDPEDIARAYALIAPKANIVTWEGYLPAVRNDAAKLAREGKVIIYKKGVPADPETFKGLYRVGRAAH